MADKKTRQRHEVIAPDRQAPAKSSWNVIKEFDGYVVVARESVLNERGVHDSGSLWRLKETYPGKDVVLFDKENSRLFVDRARWLQKGGNERLSKIKGFGKMLQFYDAPTEAPSKPIVEPAPKITRLGDLKDVKITKVHTSAETLKADASDLAQKKTFAQEKKPTVPDKKEPVRIGKKTGEALTSRWKKSTEVLTKPDKELVRRIKKQKAKKKVVVRKTVEKRLPRIGSRTRRPEALASRLAAREGAAIRHAEMKAQRHAIAEARDKARRNAKRRTPERRAAMAARRMAAPAAAFDAKLRGLANFGKAPLKMAMAEAGLSGRAPGKKAAMSKLTRVEMYPAMNRGTAAPFSASARGRQNLFTPEALMDAEGNRIPQMRGSRRGTIFSTSNTLATKKFPGGGSGIFFRIDARGVIANLTQRYPAAIRQAAIAASDRIGRKMLDIVEPYVPKDTGLLYSSGQTNVEMTAGGMVGMEDATAYPESQMFGVSISYNAPYAEIVYFDETKRHGAEYNRHYGTSEKGEKETARWIEIAFQKERGALSGLIAEYAGAITSALNSVGVSNTHSGGH